MKARDEPSSSSLKLASSRSSQQSSLIPGERFYCNDRGCNVVNRQESPDLGNRGGGTTPIPNFLNLMKFHWERAGHPLGFYQSGMNWVLPYPLNDPKPPEFGPGMVSTQLSKEIIQHWMGFCIRCGSGHHQGNECQRYSNSADTYNICNICRQGFHQSCFSPRQDLRQELVRNYGKQRINEIRELGYQIRKSQVPEASVPWNALREDQSTPQPEAIITPVENPTSVLARPAPLGWKPGPQ